MKTKERIYFFPQITVHHCKQCALLEHNKQQTNKNYFFFSLFEKQQPQFLRKKKRKANSNLKTIDSPSKFKKRGNDNRQN